MSRTRHLYYEDGSFWKTFGTSDESLAYFLTRPAYAGVTSGPKPTSYHIYRDTIYWGEYLSTPEYLIIYLAANPTYTSGDVFVPRIETRWLGQSFDRGINDGEDYFNDTLHDQRDISRAFTGRHNPLELNAFSDGGQWFAEREDEPEWTANVIIPENAVRKVTDAEGGTKYYESKFAHATRDTRKPPNDIYWNLLDIWNGTGINVARGITNVLLWTETKAIDPQSFEVDINLQFNSGQRHGFSIFAGCSKPEVALSDAGIIDGMNIFVLTSHTDELQFHIKKTNGTYENIGGTAGWTSFATGSVDADNNKKLIVPAAGYTVGSAARKLRIHIVHHQGKITLSVNDILVGTFQYEAEHYPFRRALVDGGADKGTRVDRGDFVKARGLHFGVMGGGDSAAITPAHIAIQRLCFSKLTLEEFWGQ